MDVPVLDADPSPDARPEAGADAAAPKLEIDLRFSGQFPIKAFVRGRHLVVLLERPLHLPTEQGQPSRSIRWIESDGTVVRTRGSSGMRYLLDAAVHPSGQTTLLFSDRNGYSLERTDEAGALLGTFRIVDPDVETDPPASPSGGPIEPFTFDAARVASLGEDVVVATRTGRHAVVTYRFRYDGGDQFSRQFRVLTFPPFPIAPLGLIGGTYDTFRLVEAQLLVHLAVGPEGWVYVGARYTDVSALGFARALRNAFGEQLVGDPDGLDSYVVRISANGERLGIAVVGTPEPDELQNLRAIPGAVLVPGRKEHWNAQGTGFDLLLGRVDGQTGAVSVREIDIDRGDIAFDVAPLPNGAGLLVVGATGYAQNPSGASVSEASSSFAGIWPTNGAITALPLPTAQRHNEARMITPLEDGRFLVGGMMNGPGTHSADGDRNLLMADGYLVSVP